MQATFCILLLALIFSSAYSARILDELTSLSNALETDETDVAPEMALIATLPSGQLPATVTAPDSNVVPAADPSIPATTVAPPADLPTEPEPDPAPAVTPSVSVVPPVDIANTGAASVTDAEPVATSGGGSATSGGVAAAANSGATEANPVLDHPMFSFFMHDILDGLRSPGRVVTGIRANNIVVNNNYPYLIGLNGQQAASSPPKQWQQHS